MPKGFPYFAWADASETTHGPEHLRWDENVFSFEAGQQEGDFATLTVVIKNPRIGPLHPSRQTHCWFAVECTEGNLFTFFGRLVAIPSNLIGNTVTYQFVARPPDFEIVKAALAESLKVLPYYDPVFVDPQQEDDPDIVLEGYGAIWHIDRASHTLSISDELEGEDGTLTFNPGDMLFDGLDMNTSGSPVTTVVVNAEFQWTQMADASDEGINLTPWILQNWPNESFVNRGYITSFTLNASAWPQPGAGIGEGWTVARSAAVDIYSPRPDHRENGGKTIYKWPNGSTTELESHETADFLAVPPGSISYRALVTEDQSQVKYGDDGAGGREVVSFQRGYSDTTTVVPLNFMSVFLSVTYKANRPFTEAVTFSLTADLQNWLLPPGETSVLRLNDLKSVNLSEPLGEDTDTDLPIGDARRRSYIVQDRGKQSLLHLLALARATLRKRSRVVEITFEPTLNRFHEITLRKNALVVDDRIPGGFATGKLISYSISLDGDSGAIECRATIGCAVGLGGVVSEVAGTPVYCEEEYIEQVEDYQEYTGRVITLTGNATDDVGLTLPLFDPVDDGIDFFSDLTVDDIIEENLQVNFPPAVQREHLVLGQNFATPRVNPNSFNRNIREDPRPKVVEERAAFLNAVLNNVQTVAFFKLKPMTAKFDGGVEIEVTGLKVPQQIDLEAAA